MFKTSVVNLVKFENFPRRNEIENKMSNCLHFLAAIFISNEADAFDAICGLYKNCGEICETHNRGDYK